MLMMWKIFRREKSWSLTKATAARAVVKGLPLRRPKASRSSDKRYKVVDRRGAPERAGASSLDELEGIMRNATAGDSCGDDDGTLGSELDSGRPKSMMGKVQHVVCGRGGVFILPLHKIPTRPISCSRCVLAGGGRNCGTPLADDWLIQPA